LVSSLLDEREAVLIDLVCVDVSDSVSDATSDSVRLGVPCDSVREAVKLPARVTDLLWEIDAESVSIRLCDRVFVSDTVFVVDADTDTSVDSVSL
jgi:hypothetical protein